MFDIIFQKGHKRYAFTFILTQYDKLPFKSLGQLIFLINTQQIYIYNVTKKLFQINVVLLNFLFINESLKTCISQFPQKY